MAGRPRAALRGDGPTQRQVMLGAVYDLISREGVERASMREIAAAAQVSTGTLNHHFKNKRSLLIEALRAAYHLPKDWENYVGSPEAQLRRIMQSYAMSSESNRWWRFWINYLALSTRDRVIQQEQRVRYQRQLNFWARLVDDGVRVGEFQRDLDARATARDLLVRAHGLIALQLMTPDPASRRYAREQVDAMVSALKAGPRTPASLL